MSNNKRQKLALTSSSTSPKNLVQSAPDNVLTALPLTELALRLILTCQATSDEKISILMALTRCEPPYQEQKVQVFVPRSLTQSVRKGDSELPVVTKKEATWRPDPEEVPTLLTEETTFMNKPLGKRKSMELTKEPDSGDGKIEEVNVADKLIEISDSQSQAF